MKCSEQSVLSVLKTTQNMAAQDRLESTFWAEFVTRYRDLTLSQCCPQRCQNDPKYGRSGQVEINLYS